MKKLKQQAVRFGLFFANLAAISTACAAPSIPSPLLQDSLVYCTNVSGFSFNPQKADVGTNMDVVTEQIYDKLIEFDPQTDSLKPALAERFEVSEDGLLITFHLRNNVAFHQTDWFTPSRKFNAEDVLFSLNRVSDIKSKIAEISAPSPEQVQIRLPRPDASFISHLASRFAVMLSKEYALKLQAENNLAQLDLLPVGTGVYQLASYVPHDYVRLSPNPYYWGKAANIRNMIVDFSATATGRTAKFLNGECDVLAFPEPSQIRIVPPENGYTVEAEGANLLYLAFNSNRPIGQDLTLRKRVAEAINRKRLAETFFYGQAEVAENVLPKALFPIENLGRYPYREKAEDEKIEEQGKPLVLWLIEEQRVYHPHPRKMAEALRADLNRAGIEVDVRSVSRAYLSSQIAQGSTDYDLILGGWLAENFDPNSFLSAILGCKQQRSVSNLANWCSEEFEYLLQNAVLMEDGYVRELFYRQAQMLLEEELPLLPLLHVNRVLLVNSDIEQVNISPFGQVKLSEMRLK